jgi:hypothetical protein
MRSSRRLALIGALLLATGASAGAQTPTHDADTWGWRRHQPIKAQIRQDEKAAGVALTPSQANSDAAELDGIYQQLLGSQHPT